MLVNTVNVVGAMGKGIALDEVEKAEVAEGTRKQDIFKTGELSKEATVAKYATVQMEG